MDHAADWDLRVQRLTDEARDIYTRSLRRYNDLLLRVSRGEIAADEVQRQFREYLQEQAPASTRTMVELSVGLLSGLLYIEAAYRDALLDGLLPPEGPPPPPPDPASLDMHTWFQALSRYASEQASRSLARNQRLVERIATGQVSAAQVQEQGRRYLEQAAPRLLGDVMALGLGFVEQLQRSSATVADRLYDRLLGPEEATEPSRPEPPICVDLQGPIGSIASATLLFENTRPVPAGITCEASDFTSRAGGPRFRAPIEIDPPAMTLAPGQQGEVRVHLALTSPPFEAGHDYAATLIINGVGERPQVVQLLARGRQPDTPSSAAAGPGASRATTRRARPKRPGSTSRRATATGKRSAKGRRS